MFYLFVNKIKKLVLALYKIKFLHTLLILTILGGFFLNVCLATLTEININNKFINMPLNAKIFKIFFRFEIKSLKNYIESIFNKDFNNTELPNFYMTIEEKYIKKLNLKLPESGKNIYYDAFIKLPSEEVLECEVRYRGDTSIHWAYSKKSWRIKLKNKKLYDMENKFNLVNPPHHHQIIECINYDISRDLGIISPDYYPVNLYVNGKFTGVYMYLSQTDESLLRKNKRMPGSIYTEGEINPENPIVNEVGEYEMWSNGNLWDKVSARNAETKYYRGDINLLGNIIKQEEKEFYISFNKYFDKPKWYNYFAMDVIFGGGHHDFIHNIKIYFDPYKGKIEPIQWDMRNWTAEKIKDTSWYPLIRNIKRNPILEYERDKYSYKLLNKLKKQNVVDKKMKEYKDKIIPSLKSDYNRYTSSVGENISQFIPGLIGMPYTIEDFFKSINRMERILDLRWNYLTKVYNESKVFYEIKEKEDYMIFRLLVDGNSGVLINPYDYFEKGVEIYMDNDFNHLLNNKDNLLKNEEQNLLPGRKKYEGNLMNSLTPSNILVFGKISLKPAPMLYTYFIKSNKKIKLKDLILKNNITGDKVTAKSTKITKKYNINDSIHPWKIKKQNKNKIILSGNIDIKENLVYDDNVEILIKKGTIFNIFPGKSIFFYGKVNAIGTKEDKIIFKNAFDNKPYGSVVVQGKNASGSIFEYCHFTNGSIEFTPLINYTAQINIHDLDYFIMNNCYVGQNHIGDDSMHVAYSKGLIENTIFENARSDALDMDICEIEINNCYFFNSGNDLLDIMTSKSKIQNNIFVKSGDKGISVGEWSEVDINDNIFYDCYIGIEIKDKSIVKSKKDRIINSKFKSINLYNKNKRYDKGGFLYGNGINLINNNLVTKDKKSFFKLENLVKEKKGIDFNFNSINDVFRFKNNFGKGNR